MATMSRGDSRIHDGVRDSKILWYTPSRLSQKAVSLGAETDRVVAGLSHYPMHDCNQVRRDVPRVSVVDVGDGFRYRNRNFRKENSRVDFTSKLDEGKSWFHGCNGKEDPFHGFYKGYGESYSLIVRFKKNLPVFDGFWHPEDLISWIDAIEDFFEEIDPPEHVKCKIVWYKMKGAAYYWWKQLQYERIKHGMEEIISWPGMRELLILRFEPSNCSTKCPPQNYENGSQAIEYQVKEMIDASFTPANCSAKVINQQKGEEMVEHLIVDTKSSMKSSFESHSNKHVQNEADLYEFQGKADMEIQDLEVVEGLSERKDDKQPEVALDASNQDGASFHHFTRINHLRGNINPLMHSVMDFGNSVIIPNGYCSPICVEFTKFMLDQSKESITEGLEAEGSSNKVQKIVLQEAFDPNLVDTKHAAVSISRKLYIDATELPYLPNVPTPNLLFQYVILFAGALSYLFDPGNPQSNSQRSWRFIYLLNFRSLNRSNNYADKYLKTWISSRDGYANGRDMPMAELDF